MALEVVGGVQGVAGELLMRSKAGRVAAKATVRKHTEATKRTAKSLAPVGTGRLRDSIESRYSRDSLSGWVSPTARDEKGFFYPAVVEYGRTQGGRPMPPQSFMGPAHARQEDAFVRDMQRIGRW